jgi:CDP-diacylglycerol pyrophosphatase
MQDCAENRGVGMKNNAHNLQFAFRSCTLIFTFLIKFTSVGWTADRFALWHIVHDRCVVGEIKTGDALPCSYVNISTGEQNGYAVLKDLVGKTQYLLIPTRQLSGIESPEILASNAPNYWQAAWDARRYINLRVGRDLPRNVIGMAVNSSAQRTQDQLHIHIDCLQPGVKRLVDDYAEHIHEKWTELPFELSGPRFMARRIESPDLQGVNVFQLLYSTNEMAHRDMSRQTLVVLGVKFSPNRDGFVVLSQRADPANHAFGHGEDLLDHSCSILNLSD